MLISNIKNIHFKHHPLFTTGQDMQELMSPLKRHKLSHFSYSRIDTDNGQIILTNKPEFSELFLKRKFYLRYFCDHYTAYQSGLFLADLMNYDQDFHEALQSQDLGHICMLIKKHKNHTEIFYFGVPHNANHMNHFYLNNRELLENFCHEFKEKSTALINQYATKRLFYPKSSEKSGLTNKALLEDIFVHTLKKAHLSPREQQCIEYIKKGYSAKMIANELNISNRTAEHHLAHIREKLKLSSIKELLFFN